MNHVPLATVDWIIVYTLNFGSGGFVTMYMNCIVYYCVVSPGVED